jgi:P-type Ca2+ transporter type 2C
MHLEAGDIILVDGVLLDGYNILCDESSSTGETHALMKVPAVEALSKTPPSLNFIEEFDPFILSGTKVLEGVGKFVVTAVGPNSYYGRTVMGNWALFFFPLTVSNTRRSAGRHASSD